MRNSKGTFGRFRLFSDFVNKLTGMIDMKQIRADAKEGGLPWVVIRRTFVLTGENNQTLSIRFDNPKKPHRLAHSILEKGKKKLYRKLEIIVKIELARSYHEWEAGNKEVINEYIRLLVWDRSDEVVKVLPYKEQTWDYFDASIKPEYNPQFDSWVGGLAWEYAWGYWPGRVVPMNALTGRRYQGISRFFVSNRMARSKWEQPIFMTPRQASKKGLAIDFSKPGWPLSFPDKYYYHLGYVDGKRGKQRIPIRKVRRKDSNGETTFWYLNKYEEIIHPTEIRSYNKPNWTKHWNIADTNYYEKGIDKIKYTPRQEGPQEIYDPIDYLRNCINCYKKKPNIEENEKWWGEWHYDSKLDKIFMPPERCFNTPLDYLETKLHLLFHSTGHVTRLDRYGVSMKKGKKFGRDEYERDDLMCFFATSFIYGFLGFYDKRTRWTLEYEVSQTKAIKTWRSVLMSTMDHHSAFNFYFIFNEVDDAVRYFMNNQGVGMIIV